MQMREKRSDVSKHMNVVMLAIQNVTHRPSGWKEREREGDIPVHSKTTGNLFYFIPYIQQ